MPYHRQMLILVYNGVENWATVFISNQISVHILHYILMNEFFPWQMVLLQAWKSRVETYILHIKLNQCFLDVIDGHRAGVSVT